MEISDVEISDAKLVSTIPVNTLTEIVRSPFGHLDAYGKFIHITAFAYVNVGADITSIEMHIYRRKGDGATEVGSGVEVTKTQTTSAENRVIVMEITDYVENLESVQYSAYLKCNGSSSSCALNYALIEVEIW